MFGLSNEISLLLSFLLFMGFFAGVGLASMRVKEDTTDDYLVAGRGMHPALAALSAVSTWNSGYMFIGFIGFIFIQGYSAIWIALVSTIGQLVAWIWLYKYIQKEGETRGIRSLSSLVSSTAGSPEAKVAAVLSVIFLSIYAAAQLTAGGVALKTMLGWSEIIGILIGFVLVVAYCYAGGIRASIWTDAAQSCVMIIGSTILCVVALKSTGGLSGLHDELVSIDPAMVNIFPSGLMFGATLWIAAFFLGGLGVAGQPQVVSRVMTLKDDKDRKLAMIWFFVWQTPFITLMFLIGLACRVLLPELGPGGAESGLPQLAMSELSPFLGGLILASIFAATMSTADSQVLACTAAITDDVRPQWNQDHKTTKRVTLVVAAFATLISLVGQGFPGFGDSVFALVVLAVYGLGGIFVPLILIRMTGYEPDTTHSISMMLAAMFAVVAWSILGLGDEIFPSVPGMGAAFAVHFLFCKFRGQSVSNPFGRYTLDMQKTGAIGVVVLLASFAVIEGSYQAFAPEESDSSSGNGAYQLSYTVSEWTESQTLSLSDGDTQTFSVELDDSVTAILIAELTITYSDTGEIVTSACDDVITQPDYSGLAGPFSESDDSSKTTNECDTTTIVGSIRPNSDLNQYASEGTGDYTLNGTESDLIGVLEFLAASPEMVGTVNMDVSLEANNGFPGGQDNSETITVTLRMLIFQPSGMTPVTD
ncbi:MAG: sodium/proline symporter [Candidatus Poseidonia sp.]|nr:sodium/proline symporter [Poseidonia sp.]